MERPENRQAVRRQSFFPVPGIGCNEREGEQSRLAGFAQDPELGGPELHVCFPAGLGVGGLFLLWSCNNLILTWRYRDFARSASQFDTVHGYASFLTWKTAFFGEPVCAEQPR